VAEPQPRLHPKLVDPETAPRPRIKELEVMVAEVIRETPDTATLVLFTGNDRLDYQPGHFLTIKPQQFPSLDRFCKYFEDLKGKREPARAYSLSSAPHEKYLAATVKEERYVSGLTKYPPLLSPLLVWRTPPGTRMVVTGFGGPYTLPADIEARTDHVVHICAGSGIVPNLSILKHCLETGMKVRHTLVYGNKTWEDIIFRRQLAELARRHPGKLTIVHTLSREPGSAHHGPNVRHGRVSAELIREFIPDPTAVEVFSCGPGIGKFERLAARERGEEPQPRFLETTLAALEALGVPDERIHRESYG
jgi:ferredoxin-NADP reductase